MTSTLPFCIQEKSDPNTEFHQQNLLISVLSLFFAGTETSSTTLRYGFLILLKYPHITERVHNEIDQVIGSHRAPALSDRVNMPYTDAVIHEIQRFVDLLPLSLPHTVTKDTHFRSYLLPKMRGQYGDVFTLHLGRRLVVIICGTETIREALDGQAEAFSGRGTISVMDLIFQEYGNPFGNDQSWKVIRKFFLTNMRDFRMGMWSLEAQIQEEAQCLVEELQNTKGTLQDPTFLFHSISANIISTFIFGKRFSYQDPEFLRLLELLFETFALMSYVSKVHGLFPGLLKYFPGSHRRFTNNVLEILAFISRSVEKHRETLDSTAPKDFIDTYLIQMDKEKSDPNAKNFHHKNLIMTAFSLFFAGTETTSTTLRSGILLMLKYPHIAERVQKEIDQVIGSHAPTLKDRTNMPYTDAVIHEIQRFWDISPIGVPHSVTKNTHFRGYLIPKGTEVFPILNTALYDPHYFKNPETFNPEHFLDANGKLKKSDAFMPFSIGKRMCLGEDMARSELFLFFTTILQNFTLATNIAPEDIDLTPIECAVIKLPPKYKIRFMPRHGV